MLWTAIIMKSAISGRQPIKALLLHAKKQEVTTLQTGHRHPETNIWSKNSQTIPISCHIFIPQKGSVFVCDIITFDISFSPKICSDLSYSANI